MPSLIVAQYWKLFHSQTTTYKIFCHRAFDQLMFYQHSEVPISKKIVQESIYNTFKATCLLENLPFEEPIQIPKLFSLDAELKVKGGYYYSLNKEDESHFCVKNIVISPLKRDNAEADYFTTGMINL
jgi:hypothetical protein